MPNDNDKPPVTDATVLPFNKSQRVFVPEEASAEDEQVVDVELELPEFEATLFDGSVSKFEGYLIGTTAWVGFTDEAGTLQGLLPLTTFRQIKRVDLD